jgi:hypothetical protein
MELMTTMKRFSLMILVLSVAAAASAQTSEVPPAVTPTTTFPVVSFGVLSFLEYSASLHEQNGANTFDVTRGYFNVQAQLSKRVRVRFTPDVRPTTDAGLNTNLALRLEYGYLEAKINDNTSFIFGMHETPWLTFEESINRYRVQGPMFAERIGLIPGPSDLGASVWAKRGKAEFHAGVYNGVGYGQVSPDKYKSLQGRVSYRLYSDDSAGSTVYLSGFYSYGWYARDRPRDVAIIMGSYESPHVAATAQYLSATDNPFIARNVERRGMSFFGEGRKSLIGWAGIGRLDLFVPDNTNPNNSQRRYMFGGAHWNQWGRGRLGVVISLEQLYQTQNSQLLDRRLLAQTHVEF